MSFCFYFLFLFLILNSGNYMHDIWLGMVWLFADSMKWLEIKAWLFKKKLTPGSDTASFHLHDHSSPTSPNKSLFLKGSKCFIHSATVVISSGVSPAFSWLFSAIVFLFALLIIPFGPKSLCRKMVSTTFTCFCLTGIHTSNTAQSTG